MGKKEPNIEKEYSKWVHERSGNVLSAENQRKTTSGITISPLSVPSPESFDPQHYLKNVGFSGEFPFTRGIHPTMYRGKEWTIRQYAGFGGPREANKRYRYLLSQGTTGLSIAFDLPTQMGRDSDDPLSKGEVGRVGVSISSLSDMESLLEGIALEQISTSMTINATAPILLALYLGVATKRGVSWEKLRGTIQNDILKEYVARGTYIYPPQPSLSLVADVFEFCRDHVPQWNTISISGYHIREAGSTAVQEVAFTLANAISYVESALKRGMEVDSFSPRLAFFFNCHNNFCEEVAKFRAARRMWAKIMKKRFGAKDQKSMMMRFHTQTAGSTLTAQQPEVNIVRTTLQALAAVFGGTQSLHTNAYDEAMCLPTEQSAHLALRTQQVIAKESGVVDFVDPLGGSYAIEELTDAIERQVEEYLLKIDSLGGMVKAIEEGFPQREIEESAFVYQREIEAKEREIVGINVYTDSWKLGGGEERVLKVDDRFETEQRERLISLKNSRDQEKSKAALEQLSLAVKEGTNVMPAICEAVIKEVTLGEISNIFRQFYGEYQGVM